MWKPSSAYFRKKAARFHIGEKQNLLKQVFPDPIGHPEEMLCFLFALFTVQAGRWSLRCTFVCCSHGSMICAPPVSCFSRVLYNQGIYQPWKYSILFCWFLKEFSWYGRSECELVIGSKKKKISCFHPTIISSLIFTFTDFFLQLFISARVLTEILKSCAPWHERSRLV